VIAKIQHEWHQIPLENQDQELCRIINLSLSDHYEGIINLSLSDHYEGIAKIQREWHQIPLENQEQELCRIINLSLSDLRKERQN
jgi:hypothetical protein